MYLMKEAISGDQRRSEAIRGKQRRSEEMVTYHLGLRVASILEVRLRKPFLDHFVRRPVEDPARARALAFLAFLRFGGRGALPRRQRGGVGGRARGVVRALPRRASAAATTHASTLRLLRLRRRRRRLLLQRLLLLRLLLLLLFAHQLIDSDAQDRFRGRVRGDARDAAERSGKRHLMREAIRRHSRQ